MKQTDKIDGLNSCALHTETQKITSVVSPERKGASRSIDAPFSSVKSDVEMLAYILETLYGHECDELTQSLIERFGSFRGIFRATREELSTVDGMTDRAASFFTFAMPIFRQSVIRSVRVKRIIDSESALIRYALALFMNTEQSCDYCLYLGGDGRLLRTERLEEENRIREIVGGACRYGAKRIVWLCCKPTVSGILPDSARIDEVATVIRALVAVDSEFVEYAEYAPFGFFCLRRAVFGDGRIVDAADATDDKYAPVSQFASLAEEYATSLAVRKRRMFLQS